MPSATVYRMVYAPSLAKAGQNCVMAARMPFMIPAAANVPSMGAKMPEIRSMALAAMPLGVSSSSSTEPPAARPPTATTAS